jgi:glycolate oxidase FAD binding subunit
MSIPDSARQEFRRILGPENLREGSAAEEYAVQGQAPGIVLFPGDIKEAAACSEVCFNYNLTVMPMGGRTRIGLGSPPARADAAFVTTRMNRILDYQPADMTVTVEAGLTLSRLQEALAQKGQFLPLDPPLPDRATLGGIVATRDTGGLRHAYGGPRDFLIGLRVADPEGQIVKGGSKVVKNVAGYDLPKLYCGSCGTLGLLAEMTFRVLPLPEERRTVLLSLPGPEPVEPILSRIMDSDLLPSFIEMLNPLAATRLLHASKPGWKLVLGIDGAKEDVEWQVERLKEMAAGEGGVVAEALSDADGAAFRSAMADFPLSVPSRLTVKIALLSSQVAEFARTAEELAAERGFETSLLSHAGVGLMVAHFSGAAPAEETAGLLDALREAARPVMGRVTVERADADLLARIEPWPFAGDGLPLMMKIRRSFDPKGLWNPGRFVVK